VAVEKMKIMNIVGNIGDLDKAARYIVLSGNIHMINAVAEINSNYFKLEASEENIEVMQELDVLRPYAISKDFNQDERLLKSMYELFDMKAKAESLIAEYEYDYAKTIDGMKSVFLELEEIHDKINKKIQTIEQKERYIKSLGYIQDLDIDVDKLMEKKNIDTRLISLKKDSYQKLKLNYENIPSIVFKLTVDDDNIIAIVSTPIYLMNDAERIFLSLNYMENPLPKGLKGSAKELINQLKREIHQDRKNIDELKKSISSYKEQHRNELELAYTMLVLEQKADLVKQDVALGDNLFFLFGFIPERQQKSIQSGIQNLLGNKALVITEEISKDRTGATVPTKLKNSKIFAPFEQMVRMYGTPSYNEKDPTAYFGLTYMMLFGAMFGDLGQGFVIFLIGILLGKLKGPSSGGGILSRLGISSMFFGLLYGSLFGSEEIIPALLIRPMANINTMLLGAIAFGVVLLSISFVYSLLNTMASGDIEEGVFGKDGAAGFALFLLIIVTTVGKLYGFYELSLNIIIPIAVLLLLLTVFKKPIASKLLGHKKLYDDSPTDYYIEAGFGVIETILSMASNIISFIRVGAFALNHVGLYVAFATMAKMVNSDVGGFLVLIIGNIIIIGLEGLIVFIQSLRLEYYELFSKYYSGEGVEYNPMGMEEV